MSIPPTPTGELPEEENEIEFVHFSRSIDSHDQVMRGSTSISQTQKFESLASTSQGIGQGSISPIRTLDRERQEWRESRRNQDVRERSPARFSSHAILYPEKNSTIITPSTAEEIRGIQPRNDLKTGRVVAMEENKLMSSSTMVTVNSLQINTASKEPNTPYTPFAASGPNTMINPLQIIQDQINDLTRKNQILLAEGNELREMNERLTKKEEKMIDWMKRKQEENDQLESKYREADERIKQFEQNSSKEAQLKNQLRKLYDMLEEHRLAYQKAKDSTRVK